MIRVLVADDNAVIRQGLVALLRPAPDVAVVGEAATGRQAVDLTEQLEPDVVLLDIRMPVMDGISAAALLSEHARVLMMTYTDDEDAVRRAIRAGASGYLVHGDFEPSELVQAIHRIHDGGTVVSDRVVGSIFTALRTGPVERPIRADGVRDQLTAREEEVMDLVSQGLSNQEIADELVVAEKTVKNHINHIYTKLGVSARREAMARWLGTNAGP